MANTTSHSHTDAHRLPAKRAQGLDPEFTAQPRSVADEMALEETGNEEGLSIDPEDLGSRFLSEAVEQGNYSSEPSPQSDASLIEAPSGDEALASPNFEPDRTVWEQTIDLSLQTRDPSDLRGPAFVAGDDFEDRGRTAAEEMTTAPVDLSDSGIRETSLFDREGGEGDETIAPDVATEDEGAPPREEARDRAARLDGARGVRDAAGPQPQRNASPTDLPRSFLLGIAQLLRRAADRLAPAHKHSPAVQPRKAAPSRADDPSIPHLPIG